VIRVLNITFQTKQNKTSDLTLRFLTVSHIYMQLVFQGSLCVKQDNSAVRGIFLDDPGYPSAADVFSHNSDEWGVSDRQATKPHDFNSYIAKNNDEQDNSGNATAASDSYKVGDGMTIFTPWENSNGTNTTTMMRQSLFMVLQATDGGVCNERGAAQFGTNIKGNKCSRVISGGVENACGNELNAESYGDFLGEHVMLWGGVDVKYLHWRC
jgi:hypothetical protein